MARIKAITQLLFSMFFTFFVVSCGDSDNSNSVSPTEDSKEISSSSETSSSTEIVETEISSSSVKSDVQDNESESSSSVIISSSSSEIISSSSDITEESSEPEIDSSICPIKDDPVDGAFFLTYEQDATHFTKKDSIHYSFKKEYQYSDIVDINTYVVNITTRSYDNDAILTKQKVDSYVNENGQICQSGICYYPIKKYPVIERNENYTRCGIYYIDPLGNHFKTRWRSDSVYIERFIPPILTKKNYGYTGIAGGCSDSTCNKIEVLEEKEDTFTFKTISIEYTHPTEDFTFVLENTYKFDYIKF